MNQTNALLTSSNGVEDPYSGLVEGIRWTYLVIVSSVFIVGCVNLFLFLFKQGKWRTLPLLLMYISGQLTMAFAIVRLSLPSQP